MFSFPIITNFLAPRPIEQPVPLTHMDWARQQLPISDAIRAIACVDLNAVIHRCRIGKITLKQTA